MEKVTDISALSECVSDIGNGKQKSEIFISALKFCAQGGNPNIHISIYR